MDTSISRLRPMATADRADGSGERALLESFDLATKRHQRLVSYTRFAIFVATAVIAVLFVDVEGTTAMAVVVVIAGCLQPVLPRLMTRFRPLLVQAVFDAMLVCGLAMFSSALWPIALLVVVSTSGSLAYRVSQRAYTGFAAGCFATLGIVALLDPSPERFAHIAIAVVIVAVAGGRGQLMQSELTQSQLDLRASLTASGAMVHYTNLSTGRAEWVDGDVEAVTGMSAEEWMTTDPMQLMHPADTDTFYVDVAALAEERLDRAPGALQEPGRDVAVGARHITGRRVSFGREVFAWLQPGRHRRGRGQPADSRAEPT